MPEESHEAIQVSCPCCGSALTVDPRTGAVEQWKAPQDPRKSASLSDAQKLLGEEKARVEARYQEIVRADKEKGASMDRKFQEFLEKSQGQPAARPLRDVDLD